jgi:hypothetical protein
MRNPNTMKSTTTTPSSASETIDQLFEESKKNRVKPPPQEKNKKKKQKLDAQPASLSKPASSANEPPRVHRVDEASGLPVYKYFDLGMAKPGSGFTSQCPFDCDCCF